MYGMFAYINGWFLWWIININILTLPHPNTLASTRKKSNKKNSTQGKTQKNNGWLCWRVPKKVQNHCWNLKDVAECIACWGPDSFSKKALYCWFARESWQPEKQQRHPNEVHKKLVLFESNMVGLANRQRISLSRSSCLENSMTNFQRSNLWSLVLHKILQNFKPLSSIYGYKMW